MSDIDVSPILENLRSLVLNFNNFDLKHSVLNAQTSGLAKKLDNQYAALIIKRLLRFLLVSGSNTNSSEKELHLTYIKVLASASREQLECYARLPSTSGIVFGASERSLGVNFSLLGNGILDLAIHAETTNFALVPVMLSLRHALELPLTGLRIVFDGPKPMYARVNRETLLLYGSCGQLQGELLIKENTSNISGLRVEKLRQLRNSKISIAIDDVPLLEMFPSEEVATRSAALDIELNVNQVNHFANYLEEGLVLLGDHWSEGYADVIACVQRTMPLASNGTMDPLNLSVHALRGLVATAPRGSYLSAQLLAHESGHNRLSTIIDLFPLILNNENEQFYSPFVKAMRSPYALLHGIFAFTRDLEITRRMRGRVTELPGYSLDKYYVKLRDNLSSALVTARKMRYTRAGTQVLEGCEAAFESFPTLPH